MRALLAFAVAARPTLTLRRVRTYLIHSLCEAIRVSAPTNDSTTPVLQHGRDAALRRPDIAARFPTSCHDARARLSKFDYDHGKSMSRKKLRIGVTLGDCAGIGPEIVDLALKSRRVAKSAEYKIIGKYPGCSLGQTTQETARAAAAALEEAVTLVRRGELDAIVTGPVHKARMYEAGFTFPGQT